MGGLGTPLPGAAAEDGSAAQRVQGSCRAQAPSAGDITESERGNKDGAHPYPPRRPAQRHGGREGVTDGRR